VRLQSIVLVVLVVFFSFPAQSAARELVYVPLPIENQSAVLADHAPMITYLADKLGVTIRIRYEKDDARILQLFKEGKVDLVQLGPLPYVTLKKEYARALPLVIMNEADGRPRYTCALVTSFDGPQSVEDIDSPLALTQFFSTCGYFSASLLLKKHKLDIEKLGYEYMGTHENVALAVVRGEPITGSLKTEVARRYENLTLKILEETPPFPGFLIVGNTVTLPPEQIERIRDILLQAPPEARSAWRAGQYGFSPVSGNDFDQFTRYMYDGF
jgi:phosphonate transport system substrate-binding protein